MDGVIIDSAPYHLIAWEKTFRKYGIDYNREKFVETFGQRNDYIITSAFHSKPDCATIKEIGEAKEKVFREIIGHSIKAIPGVIELICLLKECGFKQAVASSAPRMNIELILNSIAVRDSISIIIGEEDVQQSKPDPQAFQLAADRLGVSYRNALVIEDAPAGIEAAHRAGMAVIAVTTSHPSDKLNKADMVTSTIKGITEEVIKELIEKK
jgi:HAD superfamily hydrolase (TIGR01509 family)